MCLWDIGHDIGILGLILEIWDLHWILRLWGGASYHFPGNSEPGLDIGNWYLCWDIGLDIGKFGFLVDLILGIGILVMALRPLGSGARAPHNFSGNSKLGPYLNYSVEMEKKVICS